MELLLATQIMSCMTALIIAMLLFICPYEGPGFKNYNTTRKMLMTSSVFIAIQYIVQIVFQIRAHSEDLGTTCNLFFYVPCNILFMLGALNLQQIGLKKSQIYYSSAISLTVVIILLLGILISDGDYIKTANIICGVLYLCSMLYFCYLIYKGYHKMKKNIDEYYGAPIEEYFHWMKNASILLFVCFLFVPVAIFSTKAILIFGFLFWIALAYYVFNFTYFGHYAEIVDISINENEREEESAPAIGYTNITERLLNPLIENWIKEKKYCDSDITIVKLANEIGTNRTTLSKLINTNIGKSFREWINDLRIEEAKQMLREDPLKGIEDVAISCGFSTRKYFDQVFNNHEQITAAEWRKKLL